MPSLSLHQMSSMEGPLYSTRCEVVGGGGRRWEVMHIYTCIHKTEGHTIRLRVRSQNGGSQTEGGRVYQLTQWGQRHFDFFSVGIWLPKKMIGLRRNGLAKRNSLRYFSASKVEHGSRYCCFSVQNTANTLKWSGPIRALGPRHIFKWA